MTKSCSTCKHVALRSNETPCNSCVTNRGELANYEMSDDFKEQLAAEDADEQMLLDQAAERKTAAQFVVLLAAIVFFLLAVGTGVIIENVKEYNANKAEQAKGSNE